MSALVHEVPEQQQFSAETIDVIDEGTKKRFLRDNVKCLELDVA